MTEAQRTAVRAALALPSVHMALAKLNLQVSEATLGSTKDLKNVIEYTPNSHQIHTEERKLAETVGAREHCFVLLLGSTQAIEGFLVPGGALIQFKTVGTNDTISPPGVFVQAFLNAWQKSRGWSGIVLYISAPNVTTAFANRRWINPDTQPQVQVHHRNGQISRVVVFCRDGVTDLPVQRK